MSRKRKLVWQLCLAVLSVLFFGSFTVMGAQSVYFGRYPQERVEADGAEEQMLKQIFRNDGYFCVDNVHYVRKNGVFYKETPIEWYVIKDTGSHYVLLSRDVLAWSSYGGENFWDESKLRTWLNEDFLKAAFTEEEQKQMSELTVSDQEYTYDSIYITGDRLPTTITTRDKVFLLSSTDIEEDNGYSLSADILTATASAYVNSNKSACAWWLRGAHGWNYGNLQNRYVDASGNITRWYETYSYGVRPCIYVAKSASGLSTAASEPEVPRNVDLKDTLPAPKKLKAELKTYNSVKLTWQKVNGATGYRVYVKQKNGVWKFLKNCKGTSYTAKNLKTGTYYFYVCTLNKRGYFGEKFSGVKITTLGSMKKPSVRQSGSKAYVLWQKQAGAAGYDISISTSSSKKSVKGTVKSGKTISAKYGVTQEKKLYYRVRAYAKSGSKKIAGPWSSAVSYTLPKTKTVKSLAKAKVKAPDVMANGKAQKPAVTVTLGSKTLIKGVDYTVSYSSNTKVGTAKVTVKGMGNYTGTATGTFKIKKAEKNIYILCYGADKDAMMDVSLITKVLGKNKLTGYKLKLRNITCGIHSGLNAEKFNKTIEQVFANTTDDDLSFIYFCGHGKEISMAYETGEKGVRVNKVTYSGFSTGSDVKESYLWADFLDFLGKHIRGRIVLMAETCGSGGLVEAAPYCNAKDRITVFSATTSDLGSGNWYDLSGLPPVDAVAAIVRTYYFNWDTGLGNYTTALAYGFGFQNGWNPRAAYNGDGKVTVRQLYSFITKDDRVLAAGQKPQLYTPDPEMVIFER